MLERSAKVILGAACSLALIAGSGWAQQLSSLPPSMTGVADARTTCAVRDVAVITMLEDRGPSASSELLYQTFWDMVRAREACHNGRSAEGLKIYDSALLKLKTD